MAQGRGLMKRVAAAWTGAVVAGVMIAASAATFTSATAWAQGALPPAIEIAPHGSGGDVNKRLPSTALAAVKKASPAGTRVEQYLFAKLDDGTLVVGLDPVNALVRIPQQATFRPKFVAGRGLRGDDRDKTVAVVGRQYAETHKTAAGYKVAEMVYPGHTPGVIVGKTRVEVVGIFEGASAEGDKIMVVPLAAAQGLVGAPDAVSLVVVTLRAGSEVDGVRKALEAALGGTVDVRVVGTR